MQLLNAIPTSQELETAIKSATTGADEFNAKMQEIFPNFIAKAMVKNQLGTVVQVEFANVASVDQAPNRILMNCTGHMRLLMQIHDARGMVYPEMEIDLLMRGYSRDKGPKFRKIKGKTPADALKKLVVWFEKNKDVINSL